VDTEQPREIDLKGEQRIVKRAKTAYLKVELGRRHKQFEGTSDKFALRRKRGAVRTRIATARGIKGSVGKKGGRRVLAPGETTSCCRREGESASKKQEEPDILRVLRCLAVGETTITRKAHHVCHRGARGGERLRHKKKGQGRTGTKETDPQRPRVSDEGKQ